MTNDKTKTFHKFFVNVIINCSWHYLNQDTDIYQDTDINQDSNISNDNSNYNLDELIYRYNKHRSILYTKGKIFRFILIAGFHKFDPGKSSFEIKRLDSIKSFKSSDTLKELLKNSLSFFRILWLKTLMNVCKKYFRE